MLRTMRLDRPGLILLTLALPIPTAAAGPIFTHSTGAAGTRGWIQGNTGRDLPDPSSASLLGEAPALGLTLERRATGPSWWPSCLGPQWTSTVAIARGGIWKHR